MGKISSHRDLIVWQKAMDLVVPLSDLSRSFPREEIYGLTSQIRRAIVSVPSNIAEGQGRGVGNEFARHLRISRGLLQEVETQLIVAERLQYLTGAQIEPAMTLADEVSRLISGLHDSVHQR